MRCTTLILVLGLSLVPARVNSFFDYFLFVQEWPQTVCQMATVGEACKIPANCTGLAVHGIWPTQLDTEGPNYCNESVKFSWEAIDGLTAELIEFWPNCYTSTPYWSFWEHEYLKHGTCCAEIDCMATEYGFFSTVLQLYHKYNLYDVLKAGGVCPSNTTTYQASKIYDTIQEATSTKPLLYCYYDKVKKIQMLQQIVLCMEKDFSLIDCPKEAHTYGICYTDEPVYYPQRPPSS